MKFDLDKDAGKVRFMLEKRSLPSITAEVVAVIDASQSMSELYAAGAVQDALQRVVPVALNFDDNGDIPVYVFSDDFAKAAASLTRDNYADFVARHVVSVAGWRGTKLAPVLTATVGDLGFAVGGTGIVGMLIRVLGGGRANPSPHSTSGLPAIIYVFTDGENSDVEPTADLLRSLSRSGSAAYFNFIGIGDHPFAFLHRVADELPNVNFVQVGDIAAAGGGDAIYDYLLPTELTDWLAKFVKHP